MVLLRGTPAGLPSFYLKALVRRGAGQAAVTDPPDTRNNCTNTQCSIPPTLRSLSPSHISVEHLRSPRQTYSFGRAPTGCKERTEQSWGVWHACKCGACLTGTWPHGPCPASMWLGSSWGVIIVLRDECQVWLEAGATLPGT